MNNPNILTRTAYSFFNSILKVDDLIAFSLKNDYKTVSVVEKNIMYSAMELYNKAVKNNLKPIIGLEIDVEDRNEILLAKNEKGYRNLVKISSQINTSQKINESLIDENIIKVSELDNFSCYSKKTHKQILRLFSDIGKKEEPNNTTYLLTREEFSEVYAKDKLDLVDKIIDSIDLKINKNDDILPVYKDTSGKEPKEILQIKIKDSLKEIFKNNNLEANVYKERMLEEYSVITNMGFESYFLIVADIVNWSKKNGIYVGPGRGSAPGSLISYLLGITTIDPIENNLLFERFLNKDRVTMPDIDIDFEDTRRDEVIQYIAERYGKNNVAQIITFQTLRAKTSLKDVARYFNISATEAAQLTKPLGMTETLDEAFKNNKKFRLLIDSNETYLNIFKAARKIEGLPRQHSTHAAGLVISDNNINDNVPITKGYSDLYLTQYSMDYMEQNGLLKIDILGLRNLSFIKEIINKIDDQIDLDKIDYDDQRTFELLSNGNTAGIFQLESPGMRNVLKKMKPNKFEEIVATTSLFRPGPQKQINNYIDVKNGRVKPEYLDERLEEILAETNGIIIYQEQILKIAQVFSGFTLTKADILRRAIGKKDQDLINSLKAEFVQGAIENGSDESQALKIYDLIEEFAEYGFNRSHAFAYSIISYQLAYLKVRYPHEFMSSLLSSVAGNTDKTISYINEAKEMGIVIQRPSINKSEDGFVIEEKNLIAGFSVIKGVGGSVSKAIVDERGNGKYSDFIDFVIRMKGKRVSTKVIETLIKANAFSEFNISKTTLLDNLEKIENYIDLIKIAKDGEETYDRSFAQPPRLSVSEEVEENFDEETFGFEMSVSENEEKLHVEDQDKINEITEDGTSYIFTAKVESIKVIKTKQGADMSFIQVGNETGKISLTLWPAVHDKYKDIKGGQIIEVSGRLDTKFRKTIIVNKLRKVENE